MEDLKEFSLQNFEIWADDLVNLLSTEPKTAFFHGTGVGAILLTAVNQIGPQPMFLLLWAIIPLIYYDLERFEGLLVAELRDMAQRYAKTTIGRVLNFKGVGQFYWP